MNLDELASAILEQSDGRDRFVVAIAGPPGAGKSTLAAQLANKLDALHVSHAVVPMDGYHLDNVLLDKDETRNRKGSPATFDALGFIHLIKRLVASDEEVIVPVFDREQDQAIAGVQRVALSDRVVLVEGNYLLVDDSPWSALQSLWNFTVFIDPGFDVLEQRLIERWTQLDYDAEAARTWAMHNDLPNARYVIERSVTANIVLTNTD